jgi:amidase
MKYHWGALSPLLDLTTGVFPVTQVDLEKDVVPANWKPISETDKKVMDYCQTSSPSLDFNSRVS